MRLIPTTILLPALALVTLAAAQPRPPTPPKAKRAIAAVGFHKTVEPFLKVNCSGCHSAATHTSGLNVETLEALLKGGGKYGRKIIVPGRSAQSKLIDYLRGKIQPRMPMGGPAVPEAQIAKIAAWIDQGAKADVVKLGWPYTLPSVRTLPKVKNAAWCRNPIDRFVLAKLEAKGLKPAPPADKVALLRRVYTDLIGLPPTPQEAAAFLNDRAPDAYERVVDRLLADPRYGERWARHWLDLVHYADSQGYEVDSVRPHAWRYRDYVIRALNADKPYDRFLKEQLAGDELYPGDADALVATEYIRLGPWDELSTDPPQRWQDYLNDVSDTTGAVMLGLTIGCARCHNHKYDPITQADYYQLQSFFAATHWEDRPLPHAEADLPECRDKAANYSARLQTLQAEMKVLRDRYRPQALAAKQKKAKSGEKAEVNDDEIDDLLRQKEGGKFYTVMDEIHHLESARSPFLPIVEAISEDPDHVPASHLLLRGNLETPGPEVKPTFVASLTGGKEQPVAVVPPAGVRSTGRRAALAAWIADKSNPMTARVMVNRIWQHHFGRGLVATPSDFGRNGDPPTHRELLDWLAVRFVQDGWSLKKMHRLMLLSAAYRQSTRTEPKGAKLDPENKLLWRMNRIRLEGEPLRDSMLAVSGQLNPKMGGPGVYPKLSEEVLSTGSTHKWGSSPEAEGLRRTIYVFQRRSLMLPLVEAFDGADMVNTCPRRAVTTIAPQALAMFNGEFSRDASRHLAERVLQEAGEDPIRQIEQAYQVVLVRPPTPAQRALALSFMEAQSQRRLKDSSPKPGVRNAALTEPDPARLRQARLAALTDFCHVLLNTNEFLCLD